MPHSYYIPRINKAHSINYVAAQFKSIGLGIVTRVDFVAIKTNKRGPTKLQSAFVHCDSDPEWGEKEYEIVVKIQNGRSYQLKFDDNPEYWIILKARNVVPQTILNTSQIADKCVSLEKEVEQLTATLTKANQVIYELVSGLYCPTNQTEIREHLFGLLPLGLTPFISDTANSAYMWHNSPTTVQGTAAEAKINYLQLQLNEIQNRLQTNNREVDKKRAVPPPPPLIEDDADCAYNMNLDLLTWE